MSCTVCEDGKYQTMDGQGSCVDCPAGFDCADKVSATQCAAGTYSGLGVAACVACAAGEYCDSFRNTEKEHS